MVWVKSKYRRRLNGAVDERAKHTKSSRDTWEALNSRCCAEQQSCLVSDSGAVKEATGYMSEKGVQEMLNFQNVSGKAKSYQVKQFLKVVEKYKLVEE